MNLESLFREELAKRERLNESARNNYDNAIQGHTIVEEETGLRHLDLDSFDEHSKWIYDSAVHQLRSSSIQQSMFNEYIRENSGLEFDSEMIHPLEDQIKMFVSAHNDLPFADVVSKDPSEPSEEFVVIMGQQFPLSVMKDKTPEEQKQIYFSMITRAMELNGYTNEQIAECIHNLAVSFGGKEKTSSMSR